MIKSRLFTPGPTEVPPEVYQALSAPLFHHRTARFRALLEELSEGLRKVLRTRNDIVTIAGSGSAGMEAAISSACPRGRKVLVANGGKFGERWAKIARLNGLDTDEVVLDWGTGIDPDLVADRLAGGEYGAVVVVHSETSTATACDLQAIARVVGQTDAILIADCITSGGCLPVEVDAWGVDIACVSTQKALMTPPGLAILSVSDKAWARIEQITPPCLYLDLRAYRKNLATWDTPYTPATGLVRALNVAVGLINEIGIETVWRRTALLAEATRAAAGRIGLEVYSRQPSDSLTALRYPAGVDDGFRKRLGQRFGVTVAGGQGDLKGRIFRISHMGWIDAQDTLGLLGAIEWTLDELGADVPLGEGVAVAARILRDWQ